MKNQSFDHSSDSYNEEGVLSHLKHYLPSQSPLKDFIHHNTLHAFQDLKFGHAIRHASNIFGYKVSLSLQEYRDLYAKKKISDTILDNVLSASKYENAAAWKSLLLDKEYEYTDEPRVGQLRKIWKDHYKIDLNTIVHTNLFRILNSYLDQGIALKKFPNNELEFLEAIKNLEANSYVSFFKTKRAKTLLNASDTTLTSLLKILVGDERFFEQYLFDQQFAHPGWSGMVSRVEEHPETLLDPRKISLKDMIFLECLLEIDNLDNQRPGWKPISALVNAEPINVLGETILKEIDEVLNLWQEAYEMTYYDEVLGSIRQQEKRKNGQIPSFQAFFCIDDRECSIRRYVEITDPKSATYGTPGHFGVDVYYQPKNAKFYTKVCPAPLSPKHLLKEVSTDRTNGHDAHFGKTTHSLFRGWMIAQTLGFWSALKLMVQIFRPSFSPASSSSFTHMDENSYLTVENRSPNHREHGLQVGYTVEEMALRVEGVLKSTGLVDHFAPVVYVIGHGASSANNTYYAGYDCGACSGRPGSANARAFSFMANHKEVRKILKTRGIEIPDHTEFIGGLHDTTCDEIVFYDSELLSPDNMERHHQNQKVFNHALKLNAKERSRRLMSIDTFDTLEEIHNKVKQRAYSLFEPRPELNHATNALCIIGRKHMHDHLFLDRRAFLNSYNYLLDPDGTYLKNIVNAAAPVCGGINLEYFFSRVDNDKLGAGSKLPHNVMGLIGVANGFEGDLRPGLPVQMIEVHDPVRLMMVIEHRPNVVLDVFRSNPATYEWVKNEWVRLAVIEPDTREIYFFRNEEMVRYESLKGKLHPLIPEQLIKEIESHTENLPVLQLS